MTTMQDIYFVCGVRTAIGDFSNLDRVLSAEHGSEIGCAKHESTL